MDKMTGDELKTWRTERGLSLRKTAAILGQESHKTISNWEASEPPHWIKWPLSEYDAQAIIIK